MRYTLSCKSVGAHLKTAIKRQPWGIETSVLTMMAGNEIKFTEPLEVA